MSLITNFLNWLDPYSPSSIDKNLKKIEEKHKGEPELFIIRKKREYLDQVDLELDQQLKRIEKPWY